MSYAPDQYKLTVRDGAYMGRGGPVTATVTGDVAAIDLATRHRHILMLVHGFNNTQSAAEKSYKKLTDNLMSDNPKKGLPSMNPGSRPDAIIRFQWPGNAAVGPISALDFLGYPQDIQNARDSATRLDKFLRDICTAGGPLLKVSIIAHSLGCRLILEMMKNFVGSSGPQFEFFALMAPAVPVNLVDVSQNGAILAPTNRVPRTFLKFHSLADVVLLCAFPAGQELAWEKGIESARYLEAIGRYGNPTGFAEPSKKVSIGHGKYWSDNNVRNEILCGLDPTMRTQLPSRSVAPPRELPSPYDLPERD